MNDGELRQGQVLSTFGPGSMVDLPDISVLIGGLELWKFERAGRRRIYEPRLEQRIGELRGVPEVPLFAPPVDPDARDQQGVGIQVVRFPRWFLAQVDRKFQSPDGREYRTRPLVKFDNLVGGKFIDDDRKKHAVVPIRFVQACTKGHIDDIDWRGFLMKRAGNFSFDDQLWMDESGAGNDFAQIWVRHGRTNARRRLADATAPGADFALYCSGRMPWLGWSTKEKCTLPAKLLTRAASNAWFPQLLAVISIPDADEKIREAVEPVYDTYLREGAASVEDIAALRKFAQVRTALGSLPDALVWAEVQRRKSGMRPLSKGIRQAEIEMLLAQTEANHSDQGSPDFLARSRPMGTLPALLKGKLERVVLVQRLREVVSLLGFTRFEAPQTDVNGELDLGVQAAKLTLEQDWLPAVENRGEGIFLGFRKTAVDEWAQRALPRGRALEAAFRRWLQSKQLDPQNAWLGLPYVMLHTLSHLLLTQVALECGYTASSIRERVYAGPSGYGILLYTGGAGAEGTLGGLVEVGRSIESHLTKALERAGLCSNDPVCAQHETAEDVEERLLHGAACHGCLFIPETSCERRNEHLDRALVVPTLAHSDVAFFAGL